MEKSAFKETAIIKKQNGQVIKTKATRVLYIDMATGLVYTKSIEIASIDRK